MVRGAAMGTLERGGETDNLTGSVLVARRAVFDRVGRFDERYLHEYEETEWEDRVLRSGLSLRVEPAARAFHFHAYVRFPQSRLGAAPHRVPTGLSAPPLRAHRRARPSIRGSAKAAAFASEVRRDSRRGARGGFCARGLSEPFDSPFRGGRARCSRRGGGSLLGRRPVAPRPGVPDGRGDRRRSVLDGQGMSFTIRRATAEDARHLPPLHPRLSPGDDARGMAVEIRDESGRLALRRRGGRRPHRGALRGVGRAGPDRGDRDDALFPV